jgi:seryl-tRNA synthetase
MYARIKKDLDEGIGKIKWFASLLSERVRIELTVFRLLYKSEELKKKRDALLKQIGEEIYQMHKSDKAIQSSKGILDAINEIDVLEPQIKDAVDKASEISRITS